MRETWETRSTVGSRLGPISSSPPSPSLLLDVIHLSAHHAARPGGLGQDGATGRGHGGRLHAVGQRLEGQRQQGIARQNRRRLVELLVTRGPAAAQVVVIHRRQIVVDQRIGMDHFDRTRGGHGRFDVASAGLRRQQHEHRTQPLAWGQKAVAHRLAEPRGAAIVQLRLGIERGINLRAKLLGDFGKRLVRQFAGHPIAYRRHGPPEQIPSFYVDRYGSSTSMSAKQGVRRAGRRAAAVWATGGGCGVCPARPGRSWRCRRRVA